jgi:4-hydroxy-3-methylbut-2-en-1-yl diphosphate reductase
MSRSAVREVQISGTSVQRGEVLVPTLIGDPVHGLLSCAAAPLVVGSLRAKGRAVRLAELPHCEDAAADCDAVLYLETCPQEDGGTAAIAAAVAPGDGLSAATARTAIEEWAAVSGSRTLLTAGSPWCDGAVHAAEAACTAAAEHVGSGRTVHMLAPHAIPAEAAAELARLGAVLSSSLDEVGAGDVVVFPAQGVTAEIRAEAAQRGLTVVDATCPLVAAAQTAARQVAERGHQLVLIGQRGHASTPAITSQAPGHVTVVETAAGTAALEVRDARQLSYLMQPGMAVEAGAATVGALRSRYPGVKGAVPADACFAPSDRAGTIHAIAVGSELVLVLGDGESADARQMCGQVRDAGTRAQVISDVAEIRPSMLASVTTIGLAESTSAPSGLAARVTSALSGLGRLSVARRQLSTEKLAGSAV